MFSLDEMVAAFDVVDVNSNPARFDQKKADALNAEHIRLLSEEDFTERLRAYFSTHGHDTGLDDRQFAEAAQLVQTRIVVLGDAWDLLKFLNDNEFTLDEKSATKELRGERPRCSTPRSPRSRTSGSGPRRRSKWRSRSRCWKTWRSSHARRSVRSGWRPPARRSARRCSSRWNCSAVTAACAGCARGETGPLPPLPRPRREKAPANLW